MAIIMKKKMIAILIVVVLIGTIGLILVIRMKHTPFFLEASQIENMKITYLVGDGEIREKILKRDEIETICNMLNSFEKGTCKLTDPGKGWKIWIQYSDNKSLRILGDLLAIDGFVCKTYSVPFDKLNELFQYINSLD